MATQSASAPAGRDISKAGGFDTKVAVGSSKPSIGRNIEQPVVGKIGRDMGAMPGSKGKGQAVVTVKSNPPSGAANMQKGNSSMGSGSVINGMV